MTTDAKKSRRVVRARRSVTLGTLAVAVAGASVGHAAAITPDVPDGVNWVIPASSEGEGEGEGEGVTLDPEVTLIRDLGFMQGHIRAGLTLYEAGDLAAAKTHMGHPIEEKYAAVAAALEARGLGRLKDELSELARAAEAEAPMADIRPLYTRVVATIDAAREAVPAAMHVAGLVALVRVAGDEYSMAVEAGEISNLHEYQDSWGFLQVVDDQLARLAEGREEKAAKAFDKMQAALDATDAVYGDIQGAGSFEHDPSVIYGAAARMELAAARLK